MTLAAYQDAFARMVLSPALCLRARREGESAFAGSDMSPIERARLAHIAGQPGMRITCILARANRLSPVAGALPRTCMLLKPELAALLDRYWEQRPMASLQALTAGLDFGRFLEAELAAGRVSAPDAADVLREELAALLLQHAAHTGMADQGASAAAGGWTTTRSFPTSSTSMPDSPRTLPRPSAESVRESSK
jgi:hypothetical protein